MWRRDKLARIGGEIRRLWSELTRVGRVLIWRDLWSMEGGGVVPRFAVESSVEEERAWDLISEVMCFAAEERDEES